MRIPRYIHTFSNDTTRLRHIIRSMRPISIAQLVQHPANGLVQTSHFPHTNHGVSNFFSTGIF